MGDVCGTGERIAGWNEGAATWECAACPIRETVCDAVFAVFAHRTAHACSGASTQWVCSVLQRASLQLSAVLSGESPGVSGQTSDMSTILKLPELTFGFAF